MYRKFLLSILFVFTISSFALAAGGPPPPPSDNIPMPLPGIAYLALAGLYYGYKKATKE